MISFYYFLPFHIVDESATARNHAFSFMQSIRTWSNRTFMTDLSREREKLKSERGLSTSCTVGSLTKWQWRPPIVATVMSISSSQWQRQAKFEIGLNQKTTIAAAICRYILIMAN